MSRFLLSLALFLPVLWITSPGHAVAQTLTANESIVIAISPESPGANKSVRISLSSFVVDLTRARITWVLDGKTMFTGTGAVNYSFTTKALGVPTRVIVRILSPEAGFVEKAVTITPAEVDLLWEAQNSSVPLFYKGKALPSSEESIRVTAVPQFAAGSANPRPASASYVWKKDRSASSLSGASGFGKYILSFPRDLFDSGETIEVEATTGDGRKASGSVSIPEVNPFVLFYEENPLRGIQHQTALSGSVSLKKSETVVRAEPYFFSKNRPLLYTWTINNKSIPRTEDGKPTLSLRAGDARGSVTLSIGIKHPIRELQEAAQNVILRFGE